MRIFSSTTPLVEAHVIIVDIATDCVRASLVRNSFDTKLHKPVVLSYTETAILPEAFLDIHTLSNAMIRALKHSVSMLVRKGIPSVEAIHCFLHAPWVGSQTRVAKMFKETPFVFTERIASELLLKERDGLLRSIEGVSVIEEQIMSIKHNGYEVVEPFDQKTNSIEASIFFAFSDKELVRTIHTTISDIVQEKPVVFHSAHFSSFVTVRDLKSEQNEFLLLTVGGLVSHVSLISNGHLEGNASFPHGTHKLYGDMAEVLGRDHGEIASLVSLYTSGKADASLETLVKHSHKKAASSWGQSFHNALAQISQTVALPQVVYVLVGRETHTPLSSLLFAEKEHTYALSATPFNAILIHNKHVAPYVKWNTNEPLDMNTMLHSIFISRRLSQ